MFEVGKLTDTEVESLIDFLSTVLPSEVATLPSLTGTRKNKSDGNYRITPNAAGKILTPGSYRIGIGFKAVKELTNPKTNKVELYYETHISLFTSSGVLPGPVKESNIQEVKRSIIAKFGEWQTRCLMAQSRRCH